MNSRHLELKFAFIFYATILLFVSCKTNNNKSANNKLEATSSGSLQKNSSSEIDSMNQLNNDYVVEGDSSSNPQNTDENSTLALGMSAMFGKNDSGILKNIGGGKNMDSMMKKMQSMMGGKTGNPGDAISKQLLNFHLGQMSDDNPLKSVSKGMLAAQQNGTAGPAKKYTTTYADEQPTDFSIPISGDGNAIMLQYTGGSITNGKKDGLWKNLYVSTNPANKWNVYSEAYAEQSVINMKIHATSLASLYENYSINTNDQYKKYSKQQRSDIGKNESDVQVQKTGAEKMFGYNCTHVKVTYTIKGLGQVAHLQDDEWYSNEVPGAQFLSPVIFENHSPAVVKKIMEAGCSGILIKSMTTSTNSRQLIQLSKIMQKDMPDSTFIPPPNYSEDKNTSLYDIQ